jgi:hypothetical protein
LLKCIIAAESQLQASNGKVKNVKAMMMMMMMMMMI